MESREENFEDPIFDWRKAVYKSELINTDLAYLMDSISTLFPVEELDEEIKEIQKIQDEGNKKMGTNLVLSEERLTAEAIVSLAKKRKSITDEQYSELQNKVLSRIR